MKVEGLRQTAPIDPILTTPKRPVGEGSGAVEDIPVIEQKENQKEENIMQKNPKAVEKSLDLLNKAMETYSTEIRFSLHKKSGEYVVKVVNTTDNTVIREIPPERVLDMVAQIKQMLGLIVDKFI